jgi:hypothetical protein
MPEIGTSGLMSGEGKTVRCRMAQATALLLDSTDGEELGDDCGKKRAFHVANRCLLALQCASTLRHSRHERRYAASV